MGRGDWDSDKNAYKQYTNDDRLETLFGIADGWADHYLLKTGSDRYADESEYIVGHDKDGNRIKRTESEQRQVLALKAFDLLCLNFFRMKEESCYEDRETLETKWVRRIISGSLFPTVLNFFRIEKRQFSDIGIRNLSHHRDDRRSNNEKIAVDFLLKLPKFLWEWREYKISSFSSEKDKAEIAELNKMMRTRVDGAKVWMVEVLVNLRALHLLEPWIRELDAPCLAKLKEIALQAKLHGHAHSVSEERQVVTLDEACYLGSLSGWFLKKHELICREHARLTAILEAEDARDKAARKVKELTQSKE